MALDPEARAFAAYQALVANAGTLTGDVDAQGRPTATAVVRPDKSKGISEKRRIYEGMLALFGADTSYLTTNAVVLPGTMVAPAGATVQVAYPAGSGSTTGPSPTLSGTGKLT